MIKALIRFFIKNKVENKKKEVGDEAQEFKNLTDTQLRLLKVELDTKFESLKLLNVSLVTLTIMVTLFIATMNRLIVPGNKIYTLFTDISFAFLAYYLIYKAIKFTMAKMESLETTVRQIKLIENLLELHEKIKEEEKEKIEKEKIEKKEKIERREKILNRKYLR